MRFILNFIFYGILFYIIYLFFPDAFFTLVSWANKAYEFLKDLVMQLIEKFQSMRGRSGEQPLPPPEHALLWIPLWLLMKSKWEHR